MTNSKQKGARGERAWVRKLAEFGYDSTRTGFHQSQTGCESPDVTCEALPVRWEVKNAERCLVRDWLAQVVGEAKPYELPVVTWKSNNRPWVTFLRADDLLTLLQCCDLNQLEELLQQRQIKK